MSTCLVLLGMINTCLYGIFEHPPSASLSSLLLLMEVRCISIIFSLSLSLVCGGIGMVVDNDVGLEFGPVKSNSLLVVY